MVVFGRLVPVAVCASCFHLSSCHAAFFPRHAASFVVGNRGDASSGRPPIKLNRSKGRGGQEDADSSRSAGQSEGEDGSSSTKSAHESSTHGSSNVGEGANVRSGDGSRSGPILSASRPDDGDSDSDSDVVASFDSACVANPVVLPPSRQSSSSLSGRADKWQCYYYGNSGSWAGGRRPYLPTGFIGLAESDDGIRWTKVKGTEEGGSILAPTGDPDDWDGVQIGVGDVVRLVQDEDDDDDDGTKREILHMYYFGGNGEEAVPNMPGVEGFRMRIGRAKSTDGGRTWERMGMVLDYDEEEGIFASWPRIMLPPTRKQRQAEEDETGGGAEPWRMLYHAFNGTRWAVFGATSYDKGETWSRDGEMVLGPGPEGSWDESGVGTRAVLRRQEGDGDGNVEWDMVYEAVDKNGTHQLGIAHSATNKKSGGKSDDDDIEGGRTHLSWRKAEGHGYDQPGGPILQPGKKPLGHWTRGAIGTPFLIRMDDGSVRLYYVARSPENQNHAIGLVVSDSGELGPSSWREVSPN